MWKRRWSAAAVCLSLQLYETDSNRLTRTQRTQLSGPSLAWLLALKVGGPPTACGL